LFEPHRWCNC